MSIWFTFIEINISIPYFPSKILKTNKMNNFQSKTIFLVILIQTDFFRTVEK